MSLPDLVLRRGGLSLRTTRRSVLVGTLVLLACLGLGVLALTLGDYGTTSGQVAAALLGRADDPLAQYFVAELRAPRVAGALLVGAALGLAGCLFQTITQNPLGSPDVIGFTTGAATGALVQIIVLGATGPAVAAGAVLGGLGTAALVRLLVGAGGLTGQRLVLVGLGVGATLAAVNTLLVVRASLESAQSAAHWLAGSLNAVLWPRVGLLAVAVVVLAVGAVTVGRQVELLALGDDVARAVGVPAERVRGIAVVVAVALVAVATATTGPIAFVALAAPQVARWWTGGALPGILVSALTGALLVLASDLLAQHALGARELQVGVVTGALGGVYLIGLLAVVRRKR